MRNKATAMVKKAKSFTEGNLVKQIILFALPILGINVLQLFFNTADTMVLGMFVAKEKQTNAVGAVGSTATIVNLLVGLFIGISIGANVIVAKCVGEKDEEKSRKVVGNSISIGLIAGVFLAIVGFFGARTFLTWINCKDELLDMATAYLKIYFLAMPIILFYNFAAAILRAIGETLKPLIYLIIGGVLNVGFNIFFVVVLDMDADGVAIATVISNFVSAVCCFVTLRRNTGFAHFDFANLKFDKEVVKDVLYVGVNSGIHKVIFAISNMIVASAVNSFGSKVTAGNSVAHTFDVYINEIGEAFAMASLTFVSQNYGAKNYKRIIKSFLTAVSIIIVVEMITATFVLIFQDKLIGLISQDEEVIKVAKIRLTIISLTFVFVALYSSIMYVLRAIGKSTTATVISFIGGFAFRIIFIELVKWLFPSNIVMMFITYPATWGVTLIMYICVLIPSLKKVKKDFEITQEEVFSKKMKENE